MSEWDFFLNEIEKIVGKYFLFIKPSNWRELSSRFRDFFLPKSSLWNFEWGFILIGLIRNGIYLAKIFLGSKTNCSEDQFECFNGLCIPKEWVGHQILLKIDKEN